MWNVNSFDELWVFSELTRSTAVHPLHLRCCDEDSCESIANSDLSARAPRDWLIRSTNSREMSIKNIMCSRGQKRLQLIIL